MVGIRTNDRVYCEKNQALEQDHADSIQVQALFRYNEITYAGT